MGTPSARLIVPGCALVALLSLCSAIDFYAETESLSGPGADAYRIGQQELRFQEVAAAVPPAGELGYVTDQKQNIEWAMFLGAQYVLAPRVLVTLDKHPKAAWIVGNFARPIDVTQFAIRHELAVVQDYGEGVVMFRKVAK